MRRWGALLGVGLLGALAVPSADAAAPTQGPELSDASVAVLRQVCEQQWVEGLCEATGYDEPQYRSAQDPSPGQPLTWKVGVVHQHSGYSDGDPDSRPADYFAASREGHNDDGEGGDTGVVVDFVLSSEHSENEKLPITTSAACIDPSGIPDALAALDLEGVLVPLQCSNVEQADHHRKWNETLAQAIDATEVGPSGQSVGFTAMRGFEWTNDYYNHLGVYFSRNVVNAKLDGSYVAMAPFWSWLARSPDEGGGGDALVVFNHPGGLPKLTPFDGGLPHNELLQTLKGGANWDDLAHVPAVHDRVVGIEVNGTGHLAWYVKGLKRGWHLSPVGAEDHHEREWSSAEDHKTLVLTGGRSPRDYYWAFQHRRTISLQRSLIGGSPGQPATHPRIDFFADGASLDDPAATLLGGTVTGAGPHTLHLVAADLPEGSPVVLVTSTGEPVPLGVVGADGVLDAAHQVEAPAAGERWWFAVVCEPGADDCGGEGEIAAVTAPIWVEGADAPAEPTAAGPPAAPAAAAGSGAERLPATGGSGLSPWWAVALAGGLAAVALRRRPA